MQPFHLTTCRGTTKWDGKGREIELGENFTVCSSSLLSTLFFSFLFFFHLISFEALRQDPIVDVVGDTGEGAVNDFRASLGDAFGDSFSVGTVGKGEELPVRPSSQLRDTKKKIV